MQKNKGITLIALIITILILLILVGVSVSILVESSLIDKAELGKEEYQKEQIREEIENGVIQIVVEQFEKGNKTTKEIIEEELPKRIIAITATVSGEEVTGIYKGYEYRVDKNFKVILGEKELRIGERRTE